MKPSIITNLLIIIMEMRGLSISFSRNGWKSLYFYTQLSNIIALAASAVYLIIPEHSISAGIRYLSVCVLSMTFLVTVFVLIPLGGDAHDLLFSGSGLYHHLLVPILAAVSYLFLERHASGSMIWLPVSLTLIYGLVMYYLNWKRKYDGPYPFFRVYNQSLAASVIWFIVLLGAIGLISALIIFIAK